jgi:hypothetical protein
MELPTLIGKRPKGVVYRRDTRILFWRKGKNLWNQLCVGAKRSAMFSRRRRYLPHKATDTLLGHKASNAAHRVWLRSAFSSYAIY